MPAAVLEICLPGGAIWRRLNHQARRLEARAFWRAHIDVGETVAVLSGELANLLVVLNSQLRFLLRGRQMRPRFEAPALRRLHVHVLIVTVIPQRRLAGDTERRCFNRHPRSVAWTVGGR